MNKLFASALVAAAFSLSAVAAQAMPLDRNQTQESLVIPVAGGCGAGFHRGPNGGCRALTVDRLCSAWSTVRGARTASGLQCNGRLPDGLQLVLD